MCMLFVKPKDFTLPRNYFDSLKSKNPDGLSFYNQSNQALVKTMDYNEGWQYMVDNHANELVVHFRFGTSGKSTEDQLHGFSVCNDDYLLFHNGVLSSIFGIGDKSDTQILVELYKYEPVEKLIEYLEKNEKSSRFLLVSKKTNECIIPKCAEWNGDSTINGTHIIFSNTYAISYSLLDNYNSFNPKRYNSYSSDNVTSSNNYKLSLFEEDEQDDDDLTLTLIEYIWKGDSHQTNAFIRQYPDIANTLILELMTKEDLLAF